MTSWGGWGSREGIEPAADEDKVLEKEHRVGAGGIWAPQGPRPRGAESRPAISHVARSGDAGGLPVDSAFRCYLFPTEK